MKSIRLWILIYYVLSVCTVQIRDAINFLYDLLVLLGAPYVVKEYPFPGTVGRTSGYIGLWWVREGVRSSRRRRERSIVVGA